MTTATVDFAEHRVLTDPVHGKPMLLWVAGRFSGVGIEAQHRTTAQQWLGEAALAALERFTRPLTELATHKAYWSSEINRLISPVFLQHFNARGTVELLTVAVSDAPRVSDLPAKEHDAWTLELGEIVDSPTATTVRPQMLAVCVATPIAPEYLERAQLIAARAARTVVTAQCQQGKSILDLLMVPSLLNDEVNGHFVAALETHAFSRGKLRIQDIRLNTEDSAMLRDLYGQIAAARGAG